MNRIDTPFKDLFIIEPKVFEDSRGYFFESFNQARFVELLGIDVAFVQDNESCSSYGVIRGLHFQLAPYAQAKLVRVVTGTVLDVAVDLRKGSPTYGKHFSVELSETNKRMLYIPRGFAHGFSVLSQTAIVNYKCDSLYNSLSERGVRYNDSSLGIEWQINADEAIVSAKDNVLPLLDSVETNFIYGSNF